MNASAPATLVSALAGKYLTVHLGCEAYAINVKQIREIIRFQKITPVPQLPVFLKGVINLRGRIIPITDLRTRFGLAEEISSRTCIVVVQTQPANGTSTQTGLIVDRVDEVSQIGAADIEPTPEFGVQVDSRYLLGMAKAGATVRILLNLERILQTDTAD